MKTGDIVKLLPHPSIQSRKIHNDYVVLWAEPLTIDNDAKGLVHTPFFFNDIGTIVEEREVLDGYGSQFSITTWIQILCSTGVGWIKRGEVEPV